MSLKFEKSRGKIEHKGYEGWIFGGYAYAERGGPKYAVPEEEIRFRLG